MLCVGSLLRKSGFVLSTSVLMYNLSSGPTWWSLAARSRMRSVMGFLVGSNVLSIAASQLLVASDAEVVRILRNHPYITIFGTAFCVLYCKFKMKKIRERSQNNTQSVDLAWCFYSAIMGVPYCLLPSATICRILPTYITLVGLTVFLTNVVSSIDYQIFSVGWTLALVGMVASALTGLTYTFFPDAVDPQIIHQSVILTFFGILLDEFQFAKKKILDTRLIPTNKFNAAVVSFPLFVNSSILLYRLAVYYQTYLASPL